MTNLNKDIIHGLHDLETYALIAASKHLESCIATRNAWAHI